MDKRMTGGKSSVLEKACLKKGLQFLLEKGVQVVEVVTDAHVQIEALMSKHICNTLFKVNIRMATVAEYGFCMAVILLIFFLESDYLNIKHSFDIWHGSKNLGKKIIRAGQEKLKKPILQWTREVVNQFWFCASKANSEDEFISMWFGVINHVVYEHEWILPYRTGGKSFCQHGPLTEEMEKGWLVAGSPAHNALRDIVCDKRL
ncbi:uncharacterized protein LOC111101498 [Crassostrea virginica]